jgi:uncharacterized lipoprotein YmbA
MMRRHELALSALVLVIVLVCTSGCLGGASAPARFYTLAPLAALQTEADPGGPGRGAAVVLGPVTMPGYLDRIQIVTRRGRDEIEIGEFDLWSDPLRDGATRVLGQNLAVLLRENRVSVLPRRGSEPVKYAVAVDVARFEGVGGGDVALEASWRIVGGDGKELTVRRSTFSETTGAPGYGPLVAAMSRALGALSRDIATAISDLPR